MYTANILGKEGEDFALQYLLAKGFTLRVKNYRFRKAEVDLLMMDGEELVAVEVKTRSSELFGAPQNFLSTQQQRRIGQAVNAYIEEHDLCYEVRFDIVALCKEATDWTVEHIRNAFYYIV